MILWLLGCLEMDNPQVLPVQLSLMLRMEDGSFRSLLVELGRSYEHQLDVREAEGPLLYDGRHLWRWHIDFDVCCERQRWLCQPICLAAIIDLGGFGPRFTGD